jgi:hypothetical protein
MGRSVLDVFIVVGNAAGLLRNENHLYSMDACWLKICCEIAKFMKQATIS